MAAPARIGRREADATAAEYADKIRPLLADAKQAYGSIPAGAAPRVASDRVNSLVLEYAETGLPIPRLAEHLAGEISVSGIRRRLRLARATVASQGEQPQLGRTSRKRGSTDPDEINEWVEKIRAAKEESTRAYGDAVRAAYADGMALQPLADMLGQSYFSLWSCMRTAW